MADTLKQLVGNASGFLDRVAGILEASIGISDSEYANKILKYPLTPRGHMIRPFLVYTAAMSVSEKLSTEDSEKLAYFAAALELLHNASLIHDDVLDKEEKRRGKECLYKTFGETNAILSGNVYYITAFDLILDNLNKVQFKSLLKAAAEMCYGEILQQEYERKSKPVKVYFDIISKKTSALMAAACGEAARLAGADDEKVTELEKLGGLIGSIYQLQDDFKDGDAGVEEGFDFTQQVAVLIAEAERIIDSLPNKKFGKTFEEFILALKSCMNK